MMTAASIGAGDAQSYSAYLESRTVAPSRGDYYLSADGEPTEAPGRWHALEETRARLGLGDEAVRAEQLVSLMEGRHPESGEFVRRAGSNGRRGGGIDLTFSAPKSVSAVWALGSEEQRAGIEAAHGRAVERTLGYLRDEVPVVREGAGGQVLSCAGDLLAAEFRHTTARGIADGGAPDPQLHSHVVVTSVVRKDGQVAAVASRPLFGSARELGAFYRSALAGELREQGYTIETGTGRDGRYFEIAGVSQDARDALSGRSREVWLAAERFRAKYGRAPQRDELRNVKLENRRAKMPSNRVELRETWERRVEQADLDPADIEKLNAEVAHGGLVRGDDLDWRRRVTDSLTGERATFSERELRASVLEQTVGQSTPEQAIEQARTLAASTEIVQLADGLMSTREIREMEVAVKDRIEAMANTRSGNMVGEQARERASIEVAERIGGRLSSEQQHALAILTGDEHAAVLVGQAGAGKGVVIDAAARAEQHSGRETIGVAVSGSTAERLGQESPALQGKTMTLDSLVAKARSGSLSLGENSTVYFDEAGMGDTRRINALTETLAETDSKLVVIGDAQQLPSIGAGGMFAQIEKDAPTAQLSDVRRTTDPIERQAWTDLRAGRAEQAMAHYQARGQLHFSDTREQAVEEAVKQWADLSGKDGVRSVALISDASTVEIDRMNARAQHLRAHRGELGERELELKDVAYGLREHDRVAFIKQHYPSDQRRVENGTRGEVTHIDTDKQQAMVRTDAGREVNVRGEDLDSLRLSYAQHLYRQQGATVDRSVVVTGGWQTSQEGAYVQASRAREGTDWHVSREDLGTEGQDAERISRLAQMMRASRGQVASVAIKPPAPAPEDLVGRELERSTRRQLDGAVHGIDRGMGL
ncbi:MAG: MobF family relaxase [Solirubrobacteraceae bacterium]